MMAFPNDKLFDYTLRRLPKRLMQYEALKKRRLVIQAEFFPTMRTESSRMIEP
jgi:hypothetical protein